MSLCKCDSVDSTFWAPGRKESAGGRADERKHTHIWGGEEVARGMKGEMNPTEV